MKPAGWSLFGRWLPRAGAARFPLLLLGALVLCAGCELGYDTTGIAAELILPEGTGASGVGFGMEAWTGEGFCARGGYHAVPVPGGLAFALDVAAGGVLRWRSQERLGLIVDAEAGLGLYLNSGNFGLGPVVSAGVSILFPHSWAGLGARYVYAPELLREGFAAERLSRFSLALVFEIPLE